MILSREVEIYEFRLGARRWRYTDIKRPVIVEGQTFEPARGLKRGRIAQSPEESRNNLEITAPLDLSVLDLWRPFPPLARVYVHVRRVRVSDGRVRDAWSGVVSDVEEDDHEAKIRAQTLMAAVGGNGLRRVWCINCPLALYSRICGVNQDAFRTDAIAAVSAGVTLTAPQFAAHPDGWFNGGFIRWPAGGDVDTRFVLRHFGDTLTLMTPAQIPIGTEVASFPGCDRTLETCDEKFDNAPNYGGQHTIPVKSPFGDDPVF